MDNITIRLCALISVSERKLFTRIRIQLTGKNQLDGDAGIVTSVGHGLQVACGSRGGAAFLALGGSKNPSQNSEFD